MYDLASLADLKAHWPETTDTDAVLTQKLHEASVEVRALYPDVDARIASGALDADVPRLVVSRMVKRALRSVTVGAQDASGFTQFSATGGPVAFSGTVANPDGAMYLSAADRRLLATGGPGRRAFTIHPGAPQ